MDKTAEIVLKSNRKIRNKTSSILFLIAFYPFYSKNKKLIVGIIISILVAILFRFWIYIGAIIALFLTGLLVRINESRKGVRLWKRCEYDYDLLLSEGYNEKDALFIISKSFNSKLSDSFHQKVIDKFPTLDEVVVFYTGALPENTTDEEWANKCLEKTAMEKQPTGTYKARTKW
ncbi:MAG: hypothetical protein U9R23_04715 [Candidatus Cloacimonadota bacterium]|nr:hypothetical protein [Candidatus Cloacimonadota bacterium]